MGGIVGRIGDGEEFAVIFPDIPGEFRTRAEYTAAVAELADHIRHAGEVHLNQIPGIPLREGGIQTLSGSIAIIQDGDSWSSLSGRADAALLQAKQNGRDRVESEIPTVPAQGVDIAHPISTWNSRAVATAFTVIGALPCIAGLLAAARLDVPGLPAALAAAVISAMPWTIAALFWIQAALIHRAQQFAKAHPIRGPDEREKTLIPAFQDPSIVDLDTLDPNTAGPEDIEKYRHHIAFVLNGQIYAHKDQLVFLGHGLPRRLRRGLQRSILTHEVKHLRRQLARQTEGRPVP